MAINLHRRSTFSNVLVRSRMARAAVALLALAVVLLAPSAAHAQPGAPGFGPQVAISVVPQMAEAKAGDRVALAVIMDFGEGYHAWPDRPQVTLPPEFAGIFDMESVIPTEIGLVADSLPEGWLAWDTQYPAPVPQTVFYTGMPVELMSFAEQSIAYIPIQIGPDVEPGPLTFQTQVFFQSCDESVCYPPETQVQEVSLTIAAPGATSGSAASAEGYFAAFDASVFSQAPGMGADGSAAAAAGGGACEAIAVNFFGSSFPLSPCGPLGLALLLLVAALGGFLLNLTPCVLPVIPLKIMGLSKAAGDKRRLLVLGIAMSVGVVAFWMAIGGAIAFIAGFDAISSLFQTSWFSLVVGLFVGIMALGMFGLFAVNLPQSVYRFNPSQETVHGSFLFGVLTAVLSTPCTAPFMGSAAAWAATQPAAVTLATFGMIGAGMALPYFVLAVRPGLVSSVPRSGPASELVKQVMGLLMLAVATFFLGIPVSAWLQNPPAPASRGYWWVVAFFVIAAAVWLVWRTFQITKSTARFATIAGLALVVALVMAALTPGLASHGPISWTYYSPEAFAAAQADGSVVVMDFTAEWCLNCKALEAGVLHQPDIVALMRERDVVPMKVDLTGDNEIGQAKLKALDWVGIPLLAVFGPGSGYGDDTELKYDTYTQDTVRQAVQQAREGLTSAR